MGNIEPGTDKVVPAPNTALLVGGIFFLACFWPVGLLLLYLYYQQWNAHRIATRKVAASSAPGNMLPNESGGRSAEGAAPPTEGAAPPTESFSAPPRGSTPAPALPHRSFSDQLQDILNKAMPLWVGLVKFGTSLSSRQLKGTAFGVCVLVVIAVAVEATRPVVSGSVVDGLTRAPISGLNLEIVGSDEACISDTVKTGEDGSFSIDVPDCSDSLQLRIATARKDTIVGIGPIPKGETVRPTEPLRRYRHIPDGVSVVTRTGISSPPSISAPSNPDDLVLVPLQETAVPPEAVVVIALPDAKVAATVHDVSYTNGKSVLSGAIKDLAFVPTADGRHASFVTVEDLQVQTSREVDSSVRRMVTAVKLEGRMWFVRPGRFIPAASGCDGVGVLNEDADRDPFNGVARERDDYLICGDHMAIRMSAIQTASAVDEDVTRMVVEGLVAGDSIDGSKVGAANACSLLERRGSDDVRICGLPGEITGPAVVLAHRDGEEWYADAIVNASIADDVAVYALMDRLQRDHRFQDAVDAAFGIDALSSDTFGPVKVDASDDVQAHIEQKYRLAKLFPRTYRLGAVGTSLVQAIVGRESLSQVHDDTNAWDTARATALQKLTPSQRLFEAADRDVPSLTDSWFMPTRSSCGTDVPSDSTESERASLRAAVVGRYFAQEVEVTTGDRVGLTLPISFTVEDPEGVALSGVPAFTKTPEYECLCCNRFTGECEDPSDGLLDAFFDGLAQGMLGVTGCDCSGKDGFGWRPRQKVVGYTEQWNDDKVLAKNLKITLKSYDAEEPPEMSADVVFAVDSVVRNCADTSEGERFVGRVVGYRVFADGEAVSEVALVKVTDAQLAPPPSTGPVPVHVTVQAP